MDKYFGHSSADARKTPLQLGFHGTQELEDDRKKEDFFLHPVYRNDLPDIPADPKHLVLPPVMSVFEPKTEDLKTFYEQTTAMECGVTVEIVGCTYEYDEEALKQQLDENFEMHPDDMILLENEEVKPKATEKPKLDRKTMHSKKVTWLRRTEYISSEGARFKSKKGNRVEYKVGEAINRKLKLETDKYKGIKELSDRKARMKWIEGSFEDANVAGIKHPSNPDAVPVEITPVFPNFDLWKYSFVQVAFDPPPSGNQGLVSEDQMSRAYLHAISQVDDDDETVEKLGYFIPKEKVSSSSSEGEKDELSLVRDYAFRGNSSRSMSSAVDSYVFVEKDDQFTYCAIDKKISLSRPNKIDGSFKKPALKLYVDYRPLTKDEIKFHNRKEEILRAESQAGAETASGSVCDRLSTVTIPGIANSEQSSTTSTPSLQDAEPVRIMAGLAI